MASGFKPFKTKAKQFSYTPRFYSPQKEERERRREELTGRRLDLDELKERPGDMVRRQIVARRSVRANRKSRSGFLFLIFGVVILLLLAANLVPVIGEWFSGGVSNKSQSKSSEVEEFNPYAPITIVPNDYQE